MLTLSVPAARLLTTLLSLPLRSLFPFIFFLSSSSFVLTNSSSQQAFPVLDDNSLARDFVYCSFLSLESSLALFSYFILVFHLLVRGSFFHTSFMSVSASSLVLISACLLLITFLFTSIKLLLFRSIACFPSVFSSEFILQYNKLSVS